MIAALICSGGKLSNAVGLLLKSGEQRKTGQEIMNKEPQISAHPQALRRFVSIEPEDSLAKVDLAELLDEMSELFSAIPIER